MVTGDGVGRIDPKTRRALPAGIRYREDRKKYQVRVWAVGMNGEWRERLRAGRGYVPIVARTSTSPPRP